jgi:hypothetical protein
MRASSAIAIFATLASMFYSGCANRCDYTQVKCRYECKRTYQACELRGNDEWYCHNQIGECWSNCDAIRAACHSFL